MSLFRKLAFFVLLLGCLPAFAQYTSVTATLPAYNGGAVSADLVLPANSPMPTLGGSQFQTSAQSVLDSTGTFTIRIADSCVVAPTGTQWKFSFRTASGGTGFTFTSGACGGSNVVTGSSVNLSSAIVPNAAPQSPFVTVLVGQRDFAGQTANVVSTALYTVPANAQGTYEVQCYVEVTAVGTTSTMPQCQATWTTADSNVASGTANLTATSTTNTQGTNSAIQGVGAGNIVIQAKAGTVINVLSAGYASTGTAMQFALHAKVIYSGP